MVNSDNGHFRDLLTRRSRLAYFLWRVFKPNLKLEVRLKSGERLLMRPEPAEDYSSAWEVFLVELYENPTRLPGPVRRVVDVGSNVGFSCLYWFRHYPNARVVAFEPHPEHLEILRENLRRNGVADRVLLHPAAVATRSGQAYLSNQGLSSRILPRCKPEHYAVLVVDFFSTVGSEPIDLLKIDVEGSEYELLADSRFASLRVHTLVLEWHATDEYPDQMGREWCIRRLSELGYVVKEHKGLLWGLKMDHCAQVRRK